MKLLLNPCRLEAALNEWRRQNDTTTPDTMSIIQKLDFLASVGDLIELGSEEIGILGDCLAPNGLVGIPEMELILPEEENQLPQVPMHILSEMRQMPTQEPPHWA